MVSISHIVTFCKRGRGMNQNIHVICCNMDNRDSEEIARELVDNIIQIFDELMEKQAGEDSERRDFL